MNMNDLTVKLDVPISVATEPELDMLLDFNTIRGGQCSSAWIDPITHTLMLMPEQFMPSYTPDPLALTFPSGHETNWESIAIGTGNTFAINKNGDDNWVTTTDAIASANQPLVITFFCYGQSGAVGNYELINIKFGQYVLVIYSDGYSRINATGFDPQDGFVTSGDNKFAASLSNRYVKVLILPFNRREILIYSDLGGGWVYRRHDLSLDDDDNEIVDSGDKVEFKFPSSKALCKVEKASFPSTGTFTTPTYDLGYPPKDNGSAIVNSVKEDAVTATTIELLQEDGVTAYTTPDGIVRKVKAKFTLTRGTAGSDQRTPFVYAGNVTFPGKIESRTGSASEKIYRQLMLRQGFGEASLVLDPSESSNVDGWVSGVRDNASIGIYDENNHELFLGLMGAPTLRGAQAPSHDIKLSSIWKMLEQARFASDWRMDGMALDDIIGKCLRVAGIDTDRISIQAADPVEPAFPGDPRGKDTFFLIKAGATAAEVVRKAIDLWSNRTLDVRMVGDKQKIYFASETVSAPVKIIYQSAVKGVNYHPNLKIRKIRKYSQVDSAPYNEVVVRGLDIGGEYIYSDLDPDTAANTPGTAEPERPANWNGAPIIKFYEDNRLCTEDQVNHVAAILKDRFVTMVDEATWVSAYDKNIPVGSTVTLEHIGNFRVISILPVDEGIDATSRPYRTMKYIGVNG